MTDQALREAERQLAQRRDSDSIRKWLALRLRVAPTCTRCKDGRIILRFLGGNQEVVSCPVCAGATDTLSRWIRLADYAKADWAQGLLPHEPRPSVGFRIPDVDVALPPGHAILVSQLRPVIQWGVAPVVMAARAVVLKRVLKWRSENPGDRGWRRRYYGRELGEMLPQGLAYAKLWAAGAAELSVMEGYAGCTALHAYCDGITLEQPDSPEVIRDVMFLLSACVIYSEDGHEPSFLHDALRCVLRCSVALELETIETLLRHALIEFALVRLGLDPKPNAGNP